MSIFQFVLCALAVFRLTEMFVIDDGAFDIFINIRGWFNKAPIDNGLRRTIANGLTCVHCTGVWFAFIFALIISTTITEFIINWFALAGLQSIISNKLGRK